MKWLKRVAFGLLALILLPLLAVILVQAYYAATPVARSPLAETLEAKAAALPAFTENGYRAYGLRAPESIDPVVYGKCLISANNQAWQERRAALPSKLDKAAFDAWSRDWAAREEQLHNACRNGLSQLPMPAVASTLHISPTMANGDWQALRDAVPDSTLRNRVDAAWSGGPRRVGLAVESLMVPYEALLKVLRWEVADGRQRWEQGDREGAIAIWAKLLDATTERAGDGLVDAMISVAAQSQILLAVQSSVAASASLSPAAQRQLIAALAPLERMPDRIGMVMDTEWAFVPSIWQGVREQPCASLAFGMESSAVEKALCRMTAWTYDHNDTVNLLATANRWAQQSVLRAARADPSPAEATLTGPFDCSTMAWAPAVCLLFERNPIGRMLAALVAPMYSTYGTRVADLRNLAAATRLTVAARANNVAKAGLAAFVAAAPADQRNVFSGQAFAFDAASGRLQVPLRTPSTVLGKERYELPL